MFQTLGKLFRSPPADVLAGWSSVGVDNRQVGVFQPSCETPAGCVLFLHGHGRVGLNENRVFSQLFQDHNLVAVCPDGGRSWWMDRVSSEFDSHQSPMQWLRRSIVPFIESHWKIATPQIALLGVSMGGQGVLQLAYRYAREFPVVAAISPAVDFHQLHGHGLPLDSMYETAEDARQETVVLNLHPLAWPRRQFFCCDPEDADWFHGCTRLGMKLSSSGIMYERDLETSAGGHSWDYFNHMAPVAIDHIVKGLDSVANEM
jgi:S-formylglutathione hydrolase